VTVREALTDATARLREAEIDTPYLDAVLLLCHCMTISKERLYTVLPEEMDGGIALSFGEALARRETGIPVAYIKGIREFYGRPFKVDPSVLVPRPDTETLVDAALEAVDAASGPVRIHDCCTGSGCVAITLKAERPNCEVSASDISGHALKIASWNARRVLDTEIPLYESDLLDSVPGTFDIITANPPYLTSAEVDEMMERGWPEPVLALDGGEDGLDIVRRLVGSAVVSLGEYGYICIETADPQASDTRKIMLQAGFVDIETRMDLGGRRRVTCGRRSL
jgi:release factor glutamine methyltransferase